MVRSDSGTCSVLGEVDSGCILSRDAAVYILVASLYLLPLSFSCEKGHLVFIKRYLLEILCALFASST